ncbi:MAG: hypothetical protein ABSG96_11700 [Terracidiphilus sp.]
MPNEDLKRDVDENEAKLEELERGEQALEAPVKEERPGVHGWRSSK